MCEGEPKTSRPPSEWVLGLTVGGYPFKHAKDSVTGILGTLDPVLLSTFSPHSPTRYANDQLMLVMRWRVHILGRREIDAGGSHLATR